MGLIFFVFIFSMIEQILLFVQIFEVLDTSSTMTYQRLQMSMSTALDELDVSAIVAKL